MTIAAYEIFESMTKNAIEHSYEYGCIDEFTVDTTDQAALCIDIASNICDERDWKFNYAEEWNRRYVWGYPKGDDNSGEFRFIIEIVA